jgi:hypothetical protein
VLDAAGDGEIAHETGEQSGIDVIGIVDVIGVALGIRLSRPFPGGDHRRIRHRALGVGRSQPMRSELVIVIDGRKPAAGRRVIERMKETGRDFRSRPRPVDEANAQLEGPVGPADELGLVDPDILQRDLQILNGRFADADGGDIGRLDQSDLNPSFPGVLVEARIEGQRGQPAGGAAAHDGDALDLVAHSFSRTAPFRRRSRQPQ